MFTKVQIVNMIFGNWSDLETRKLNLTDQRFNETQIILDNNASWLSTYNATYDAKVTNNESWNESLADSKYALTGSGGNASWNESNANDLYVQKSGDNMTGDLNFKDNKKLIMGTDGATDYYQEFDGTDTQYYTSGDLFYWWDINVQKGGAKVTVKNAAGNVRAYVGYISGTDNGQAYYYDNTNSLRIYLNTAGESYF